ncbi:Hypothetical protein D9617_13g099730 [Elsinoe fawcettii]|nr:Hypothetical protein D9617_13g099730 [Elsinoe fawcettii]
MASKPSWKRRFTPEQLERKRQVDRIAQQKLRSQSKQTTKQLESRLQLAISGEHSALIQSLLDENADLRKTIEHYRSCLDGVAALVRPCLDSEEDAQDNPVGLDTGARRSRSAHVVSMGSERLSLPRLSRQTSFFFHAKDLVGLDPDLCFEDVSTDKIIEAVMLWKLSNNHGIGPRFLDDVLDMNRPVGSKSLLDDHQQMLSSTRFHHFLYDVLTGTKDALEDDSSSPHGPSHQIHQNELQKRAVMLYAYETIRPWRPYFTSHYEWSVIFWSIQLYLEFLTWPSTATLMQLPTYLWPTPAQFARDHPQFVDQLVWPGIRKAISSDNHHYNLDELVLALVESFELCVGTIRPLPPVFQAPLVGSGIQLHPKMFGVMYNLENFKIRDVFFRKYPQMSADMPRGGGQDTSASISSLHEDVSTHTIQTLATSSRGDSSIAWTPQDAWTAPESALSFTMTT